MTGPDETEEGDDAFWNEQAQKLRRTQLDQLNTSAGKWSTLTTGLLGIFSTVTFAGGLDTIGKYPTPWHGILTVLVVVAAVALAVSLVFLTLASGSLRWHTFMRLSGDTLRAFVHEQTKPTKRNLRVGQWTAINGVILIAAASAIVFLADRKAPTPPSVAGVVNGKLVCGDLTRQGSTVNIGTGEPDGQVSYLIAVDACP